MRRGDGVYEDEVGSQRLSAWAGVADLGEDSKAKRLGTDYNCQELREDN